MLLLLPEIPVILCNSSFNRMSQQKPKTKFESSVQYLRDTLLFLKYILK